MSDARGGALRAAPAAAVHGLGASGSVLAALRADTRRARFVAASAPRITTLDPTVQPSSELHVVDFVPQIGSSEPELTFARFFHDDGLVRHLSTSVRDPTAIATLYSRKQATNPRLSSIISLWQMSVATDADDQEVDVFDVSVNENVDHDLPRLGNVVGSLTQVCSLSHATIEGLSQNVLTFDWGTNEIDDSQLVLAGHGIPSGDGKRKIVLQSLPLATSSNVERSIDIEADSVSNLKFIGHSRVGLIAQQNTECRGKCLFFDLRASTNPCYHSISLSGIAPTAMFYDNETIAVGFNDGGIRIWDSRMLSNTSTNNKHYTVATIHTGPVSSISMSKQSNTYKVLSGCFDGTISVCDVQGIQDSKVQKAPIMETQSEKIIPFSKKNETEANAPSVYETYAKAFKQLSGRTTSTKVSSTNLVDNFYGVSSLDAVSQSLPVKSVALNSGTPSCYAALLEDGTIFVNML